MVLPSSRTGAKSRRAIAISVFFLRASLADCQPDCHQGVALAMLEQRVHRWRLAATTMSPGTRGKAVRLLGD